MLIDYAILEDVLLRKGKPWNGCKIRYTGYMNKRSQFCSYFPVMCRESQIITRVAVHRVNQKEIERV